jgi:hypothetical protein
MFYSVKIKSLNLLTNILNLLRSEMVESVTKRGHRGKGIIIKLYN